MRKKLLLICIAILFIACHHARAQSGAIGFHVTMSEYDGDLNDNQHHFYDFNYKQVGGAVSLQQYLNPSFNLVEKVSFNQVRHQNDLATIGVDADFYTVNLKLKYKLNNGYLLKEEAAIAPFLVAGIGGTYIDSKQFVESSSSPITDGEVKANVAAGVGILFQFNDRVGLEVANTINAPLYDAWDGVDQGGNDLYLQHSAGLIFNLRKPRDVDNDGVADRKDKCADTPATAKVDSKGCPVDTDKDGVADYLDKCPMLAGTTTLAGCPDKDGDGVADGDDTCPDVPGATRFAGCPDTDGDGIEDSKDKCPNLAGLDIFQGCADGDSDGVEDSKDKCPNTEKGIKVDEVGCPADTDGDGVTDNLDACPTSKGEGSVNGCPEIKEEVKKRLNFATRGIAFENGKAVLKPSSFPMLNEVVSILEEYKDYKLKMGGHTDASGSNATNLTLSQARVESVKAYLVSKGVSEDRIEAVGYGEEQPIATNGTAAGRAQNRRVALELILK
ncbi:OmpA family protein [Fulvivirgaceae bacterium PWU5]|uniref:OmpA family protein n=1 Tax=Dawidia cretensis TaxID=2782350 RepID=A0AAP2GW13_9BACT|nr:OmpA family protein [Dawidia cretensis]MBT1711525.1 OmpA family protein [Dawidia cretensis]